MAASSSAPVADVPFILRELKLFPLLKQIHALPNLPPLLCGLTFPELLIDPTTLDSSPLSPDHPLLATLQAAIRALEEHQEFSPLLSDVQAIYRGYLDELCSTQVGAQRKLLNGPVRLFALLRKEEVSLFVVQKRGQELTAMGPYEANTFGTEAIFSSEGAPCQRETLEKIFPHQLLEKRELAPLLTHLPHGGLRIEECSPLAALHCWIVPNLKTLPALESLFLTFRELVASDELLLQALSDRAIPATLSFVEGGKRRDEPANLTTFKGYQAVVNALIELGSHPNSVTSQGETLLHLAAAQGDLALVSFFLKQPASKEWLQRGDIDGETPLHLAARQGHAPIVQLLLMAGARSDQLNCQQESPLDLALNWGRDEVISLLLNRSFYPNSLDGGDPEGAAYRSFEAAHEAQESTEQLFWLEKLAQIHIRKKSYTIAAHLLNAASTLTKDPVCKNLILNQLERLEGFLLFELFGKRTPLHHRGYLAKYRLSIERVRARVAHYLQEKRPVEEIQEFLTRSYRAILATLIDESITLVGEGYPKFAAMGLGSMARLEMSPYSDLEFVFLIDEASPEALNYFRKLSQLLALKLINMGETERELLRPKRIAGEVSPGKSLVSSGFSMDIGGLSPVGNGVHELIGTPRQLAELQTEEWLRRHSGEVILINAMSTVCCITGNHQLVAAYQEAVRQTLDSSPAASSSSGPAERLRERRALNLIQGHVSEFHPRLDQAKIDLRGFDVKKELYRLPQTVISGLALYYGLESSNTLEQIDELQARGIFSADGASRLKEAFRSTLKLRMETHFFYKTERELLYHSQGEGDKSAEGLFIISPELGREITLIYRTLVPLHQAAQRFLEGDRAAFANSPLYEPTIGSYDDQLRERFQFDAALASAEEQAALNPGLASAHSNLGKVQLDLGEPEKAVDCFEKAYALLKEQHGDQSHQEVAIALNDLGLSYYQLGDYQKALDLFTASIKMFKELYRDLSGSKAVALLDQLGIDTPSADLSQIDHPYLYPVHPDIARILGNIGACYGSLDQYEKAVKYLRRSIEMNNELYKKDEVSLDMANALSKLGALLKDHKQGISLIRDAIAIKTLFYRDQPHPSIAQDFMNIGSICYVKKEYEEAVESLDLALSIYQKVYRDRFHPLIKKVVHRLILACNELSLHEANLKNSAKAIANWNYLLERYRGVCGDEPNEGIARALNRLGSLCYNAGDSVKGLEHLNACLAIRTKLYGDQPHPQLIEILNDLGIINFNLLDYSQAAAAWERLLSLLRGVPGGQSRPSISEVLHHLSGCYQRLGEFQKAIDSYRSLIEKLQEAHHNQPNEESAKALENLGKAYFSSLGTQWIYIYREPLKSINQEIVERGIACLLSSLAIMKQLSLSTDNRLDRVKLMNTLGTTYLLKVGGASSAVQQHESALSLLEKVSSLNNSALKVETLEQAALANLALGQFDRAIEHYTSAHDLATRLFGPSAPLTKSIYDSIQGALSNKSKPHNQRFERFKFSTSSS